MARVCWPIMVAALVLGTGPLREPPIARVIVVAAMLAAVMGLNVPTIGVIRRARREDAPPRLVNALVIAATLRLGAAAALAAVLLG